MTDANSGADLQRYVNLASARLGARAHAASDEFFADKSRLIDDAEPVFVPGRYDANGKWMDGWESRRRRGLGHDWCVIELAVPGVIAYIDIDTRHFTGNYPPGASVEGSAAPHPPESEADWFALVPPVALGPDRHHLLAVEAARPVRWLRLSIHPDGGVARLRAYGHPVPPSVTATDEVELSALKNGGRIVAVSDAHYGTPWIILTEGRGRDMGDGWETRRRREPGHDWIVVALGIPGDVTRLEIDTAHFKGNFPDEVSVQACAMPALPDAALVTQAMFWPQLLPARKAQADFLHVFGPDALAPLGAVTHLRLNIHPDGGISRFRAFGRPRRV